MPEAAPRRIEYRPLSALVPAPKNPKRHDLDSLAQSIARFGIIDPVVEDGRTGRLISGHGRTETLALAEQAGLEPPDGVRSTAGGWRVPVVTGWASSSDAEAEAALVAVNQLTVTGGWDEAELASLLADLPADGGLAGVGFSDADVADLLASVGVPDPDMPTPGDERYTPAWIFEGMGLRFDIDVAAPVDVAQRRTPADRFLTVHDDGLNAEWSGLVWMNPPYSTAAAWARRWMAHPDGVCLIVVSNARWVPELFEVADRVAMLPNLKFDTPLDQTGDISSCTFLASLGSGTPGLERLAALRNWPLMAAAARRPRPADPIGAVAA